MIVEEIMKTDVITLTHNHTIKDALQMNASHIKFDIFRSLMKIKTVVGIVTDRDITRCHYLPS